VWFTLSFAENPYDVLMTRVRYGAVIGLKKSHKLETVTGHIQKNAFLGQSQRRI